MDTFDPAEEVRARVGKARKWLLAVGILMFVFGTAMAFREPDEMARNVIIVINGVVLVIFVGLWWFAKRRPKLGLGLGLAVFWGLQLVEAAFDPSSLFKGLIVKILFTLALVKGLQAASEAEDLRAKLKDVFE